MKIAINVLLGIGMAALLTEAVLQLVDRNTYSRVINDPNSGLLTFVPNATLTVSGACYENVIRTNRLGLYAPEYEREKQKNVFRVAIIGSSFVEAVQIPLEKNFTRILQDALNAHQTSTTYEVLPFAFSGNGTYLDLLYFRAFALPYAPDLVIDLTTDFALDKNAETATYPPKFDQEGRLIVELSSAARSDVMRGIKQVARQSKLAMNLTKKALLVKNLLTQTEPKQPNQIRLDGIREASIAKPSVDLWKKEDAILQEFQRLSADNHARFMLVSWVSDLRDMTGHTEFGEELATIAKKRGFPYLNLQPLLLERERREGQKPILPCDGHWNETGHRWAAEELFTFLQQHPALLKSVEKQIL